MISMVEKITRLKIKGCETQLELMKKELHDNKEMFLYCPEILDFERAWVGEYIG